MLLIVHILIEEIQDIHCHTIGFTGRAVGIEVDSILVVVQSQLPVALFTVGISQEIESFVPVGRVGDQIFIELPDSFCYISLIDKLFDSFQYAIILYVCFQQFHTSSFGSDSDILRGSRQQDRFSCTNSQLITFIVSHLARSFHTDKDHE